MRGLGLSPLLSRNIWIYIISLAQEINLAQAARSSRQGSVPISMDFKSLFLASQLFEVDS